ncbi:hypothetical protein ACFVG1_16395 [Streptomyces bacillaris]|uniref:hypothetical protein n=1 Tax=Streptomyces bacillaris TaxID=68179 RepID=UPI00335F0572
MAVVAATVSLHGWWNTNVFGDEALCGETLDSDVVQGMLDSPGRLSVASAQIGPDFPEFRCVVERTSKFTGAEDQRVTVGTGSRQGAFPFATAVWKDPASRSYFKSGRSGAVSGSGGYVILPVSCWDKVGDIQGNQVRRGGKAAVATVEATVEKGSADRAGLARLLDRTAQRVAEKAGCADRGPAEPVLAAPAEPRPTNPAEVCGLPGLSLPQDVVLAGVATPGSEQVNSAASHTWACDMQLAGSSKSRLSFVAASDRAVVDAALRDTGALRELPGNDGWAATTQAVLHCRGGDVYFAARWNTEYEGALLHSTGTPERFGDARRDTFQKFLDAAAPSRSCPSVTLPTES